ncbi:MAG TPA: Nramp family divalent metal transporter [Candidatus Acidoferrales bacterium]|nr:Nramp family divalent metal transporter [Candidatus Acidoferrales bacterium]
MSERLKRFFRILGPGLVTGAADDDPSGISTYSVAGASTGFSMLWIALITTPMMAVVQGMCERIGMVTGVGLATNMRRRLNPWLLYPLCLSVIVANTINAGADLEGMSAAARLVFGLPHFVWDLLFGAALALITIFLSYRVFFAIVKWLTLSLFAYVVTAFVVRPDWLGVFRHLVIPEVHFSSDWLTTLVAVLGTTITPYLFFWQASLEVEDEKQAGRTTERQRRGATPQQIADAHLDVNFGMIFSNLVAFFIIVTTAATLGAHGKHDIASAADAARALEPLAGKFAGLLFAAGMIGTGLLAIPALVGSSAYVVVEVFKLREGLSQKVSRAPQFYGVLAAGIGVSVLMGLFEVNPIAALFWSAVINGVVAVPLLAVIVAFASDRRVLHEWTSSLTARIWGWATVAAMLLAAIGMFAFWGKGS